MLVLAWWCSRYNFISLYNVSIWACLKFKYSFGHAIIGEVCSKMRHTKKLTGARDGHRVPCPVGHRLSLVGRDRRDTRLTAVTQG